MRTTLCSAMLVAMFVGPALLAAQETYTIKFKKNVQGDCFQVQSENVVEAKIEVLDADGNAIRENTNKSHDSYVYEETILEKPADPKSKPVRLRRAYKKAQVEEGDKKETLPYENKVLLIERKGEKYHFRIEGGEEVIGKGAKRLDSVFNKNDAPDLEELMKPKEPLPLKGTWKIEARPLADAFAKGTPLQVDADKADASGKLLRIYEKENLRFGIMEIRLGIPVKGMDLGKLKLAFGSGAKLDILVSLDVCIDGSVETGTAKYAATMKGKGDLTTENGQQIPMAVTMEINSSETRKETTKK